MCHSDVSDNVDADVIADVDVNADVKTDVHIDADAGFDVIDAGEANEVDVQM